MLTRGQAVLWQRHPNLREKKQRLLRLGQCSSLWDRHPLFWWKMRQKLHRSVQGWRPTLRRNPYPSLQKTSLWLHRMEHCNHLYQRTSLRQHDVQMHRHLHQSMQRKCRSMRHQGRNANLQKASQWLYRLGFGTSLPLWTSLQKRKMRTHLPRQMHPERQPMRRNPSPNLRETSERLHRLVCPQSLPHRADLPRLQVPNRLHPPLRSWPNHLPNQPNQILCIARQVLDLGSWHPLPLGPNLLRRCLRTRLCHALQRHRTLRHQGLRRNLNHPRRCQNHLQNRSLDHPRQTNLYRPSFQYRS